MNDRPTINFFCIHQYQANCSASLAVQYTRSVDQHQCPYRIEHISLLFTSYNSSRHERFHIFFQTHQISKQIRTKVKNRRCCKRTDFQTIETPALEKKNKKDKSHSYPEMLHWRPVVNEKNNQGKGYKNIWIGYVRPTECQTTPLTKEEIAFTD